jgi:biopolymer transport protein ExbD
MTISPTKPLGLKAEVPQPPRPGQHIEPQNTAIVLSMNRNGVIKINQDEVESVQLIGRLQDIFKSRSDRTVFLQADSDLLFHDVAQLIDAAKTAGVDQLGLMTEHISSQ